MNSILRKESRLGRWAPVVLYALIVLGWLAEGLSHDAARQYTWLVVWTLPAPALYFWRTRRRE